MELVLGLSFLSHHINLNQSILLYFGNKKGIPLLFFKHKKKMIAKLKRDFLNKQKP